MKKLVLLSLCMMPLAASFAFAAGCDRMAVYRSCMSEEGSKPDSTRSGLSASDFCKTMTVMQCPY